MQNNEIPEFLYDQNTEDYLFEVGTYIGVSKARRFEGRFNNKLMQLVTPLHATMHTGFMREFCAYSFRIKSFKNR